MKPRFNSKALVLCLFSLLIWGVFCAASHQDSPALTVENTRGERLSIALEIAATPEAWSKGLMNRKKLALMSGMLFVFPDDQVRMFWMKDTEIPLDMIFIDRDLKIVGIVENAQPRTLVPRQVDAASRYVLEVNGGFCRRFGVKTGKTVQLKGFVIPSQIH